MVFEFQVLDKDIELLSKSFDCYRDIQCQHVAKLMVSRDALLQAGMMVPSHMEEEIAMQLGYWDRLMMYAAVLSCELEKRCSEKKAKDNVI
jgi:hypothetical protein